LNLTDNIQPYALNVIRFILYKNDLNITETYLYDKII